MRHVGEDVSFVLVGNLAESLIFEIPRVAGDAGDDHLGVEKARILLETVVVN